MYASVTIFADTRGAVDAVEFIESVRVYADYYGYHLSDEDEEFIVDAYLNHDWDSCKTYHKLRTYK